MEKMRYEYWKLFKTVNYSIVNFIILCIFLSGIESNDMLISLALFIMLNIMTIVLIYINTKTKYGIYFSSDGILIVSILNKSEFIDWNNLTFDEHQEFNSNIGNYLQLRLINLSSNKERRIFINDYNEKSFQGLLSMYSRRNIKLIKSLNMYNEKKISDYWNLIIILIAILIIVYFKLPIFVK